MVFALVVGMFSGYMRPEKVLAYSTAEPEVVRLAGADRFETSILAAEELKKALELDKFSAMVVASGTGFADALAGSYLGARMNAPVLLVADGRGGAVMDKMTAYVKENLSEDGTVYVLGGTGAVPASFEEKMGEAYAERITRIQGSDRYETNLMIINAGEFEDGEDILVCTGLSFPDSLSAAATGKAILLVPGNRLLEEQTEFLKGLTGTHNIYIIGGEGVVTKEVEDALCELEIGNVKRIAGADRFKTSTAVAREFFVTPTTLTLAYAANYPDGLSAGPMAFACGSPLLLVQNSENVIATVESYARVNSHNGQKVYVLGGESLISEDAAERILEAAASVEVETVKTGIEAYYVTNAGFGYGQLIRPAGRDYDEKALLSKDGELVFDYNITPYDYGVDGEYITLSNSPADMTEYYDMSIEEQLSPKMWKLTEDGPTEVVLNACMAYPVRNDMVLGFTEVKGGDWVRTPAVYDLDGTVLYTFPAGFNVSWVGGGNISSRYCADYCSGSKVLGWYGDGLITCYSYKDGVIETVSFYDKTGKEKLELTDYDDAGYFSCGLVAVRDRETGLWGYADRKGNEVIPCSFEYAGAFADGAAVVGDGTHYGYIDLEGNVIVPIEYDEAFGAGYGLVAVEKDGKCGLLNYAGEVVVPLSYDSITSFEGGAAYAVKDCLVEIIRLKTEEVLE